MQVGEVVRGPGGEQLSKRDGAEGGVRAETVKVGRLQIQVGKIAEADGALMGKLFEELRKSLAVNCADVAEPVKGREGLRLAVLEDVARTGKPVRPFAVDEMAHHIMRIPCVRTLVSKRECLRKIAEERGERGRRAAEQSKRVEQGWFHGVASRKVRRPW